jgi:carboxymethylenebutenolidase
MILTTPDGTEFEVFPVGPDDARFAVILVHDWWGVLNYNKDWAKRLADELGAKAVVVDLYDGERARNAEEAGEIMRNLDQDLADAKLLSAIEYLKDGGRKVAVLGWSLGGRQALQAALLDPEAVRACILFYCRLINDTDQLQELGGPVLAIYAENERTWPDKMEKFNAAMAEVGKPVESVSYNAGHGFVNPGSDRYSAEHTADAWRRVVAFLRSQFP